MSAPSVYEYRDYRRFLRELFHWRKETEGYSYRKFSADAGLNSPNYLKLVIDGDRNLSLEKATAFAKGFGLNQEDTAYFMLLVRFGNARDAEEKAQLFALLEHHRKAEKTLENLDAYQAYFAHWAYPVLGILLTFKGVPQDPMTLARTLKPAVPVEEIRKALDVLTALNMVEQLDDGTWKVLEPVLETPEEIRQVWMRQYHRRVLQLALLSLEEVPQEKRNVSTFAVGLPASRLDEFLQHVHRLRKELFHYALELSTSVDDPDDIIMQVGIQAFPVAEVSEDPESGSG